MGISAERGKPLDKEFDVPIFDFLEADSEAPLNLPKPDDIKLPDQLKVGPELSKSFEDALQVDSVQDLLEAPDKLTEAFMGAISPSDPNVGNQLKGGQLTGLIDEMTKSMSETRRRLANNPNVGPLNRREQCYLGINTLLRALNRLTGGLFGDINRFIYEVGAWVGMLNRMMCAGVPNGFSKLSPFMPPRAIPSIGVGSLLAASKTGNVNTIIDIGKSSVGSTLGQSSTGIAALGVSALNNTNLATITNKQQFVKDFDEAMGNMDKDWLNPDKYPLSFDRTGGKSQELSGFQQYLEMSASLKTGSVDANELKAPVVDDKTLLMGALTDTSPKTSWRTFVNV